MPERKERYIIEKEEPLYFTDYYTWRSDYDYFFWPIGIMAFLFFFVFFIFLVVNTEDQEDQIYFDLIVIFVIMIFFVAVVVMFCLNDEYYQTRKASDSLTGKSIDRLKSLQVQVKSKKKRQK